MNNREHFRAYAHGLIARLIRENLVGKKMPVEEAVLAVARGFYEDLRRDSAWVAAEIGRELGSAAAAAGAALGGRYLDAVATKSDSSVARAGARAGRAVLAEVGAVVAELLRGGR